MRDYIGEILGISPLYLEPMDFEEAKRHSKVTGKVGLPKEVYGTQDRSFMQTAEYKTKQSIHSKRVWDNSPERKIKARATLQQATRKKVLAEGVVYDSLTLCAEHYGVCLETIRLWMRKGKDFRYL